MKKLNVRIIIQARVGSTRLPGKILKEVCGKTILEHDIERALRVNNAHGVVIATTTEPEAERIVDLCGRFPQERVGVYRGSVDDVLKRYCNAAKKFHADVVCRITSDCPLLDPRLADEMIGAFLMRRNRPDAPDYLCNNMPPRYPHGLDVEVFTIEALKRADAEASEPFEREHVTPYIRNHPELFRIDAVSQKADQSRHRWTLDYPEDLEFIRAVYDRLYHEKPHFDRGDVLRLLEREPELLKINEKRRSR